MLVAFVGGFPSTARHVSLDSGAISSLDLASATGSASSITALMSLSLFVLSSDSSTASSLFYMPASISPLSFALFTVPRSFGNSTLAAHFLSFLPVLHMHTLDTWFRPKLDQWSSRWHGKRKII